MHVKGKVKRYTLSHFPLKTTRENFFPREKKTREIYFLQ